MSERLSIAFQGTKSGLVIAVDTELSFDQLMVNLDRKLVSSGSFFSDASVVVKLGERSLDEKNLKTLCKTITDQHNLHITSLSTTSAETAAAAEILGIPAIGNGTAASPPNSTTARAYSLKQRTSHRTNDNLPTDLLRTTVRSGQFYETAGHLVILGDVNSAAEIVAAGDIIVFGALRGTAYAGATGAQDAIIVALKLRPQLLRIAGIAARPQDAIKTAGSAEFAFIEDQQIVIDNWNNINHLTITT